MAKTQSRIRLWQSVAAIFMITTLIAGVKWYTAFGDNQKLERKIDKVTKEKEATETQLRAELDIFKKKPKVRHAPVRIGAEVLQSKLVKKVEPVYPELAKRALVEGFVMLTVIVNKEGRVEDVQVVRGNPLLNDAAVQAVRQWVYSPTVRNNEPVPVTAAVIVFFKLR